MATNLRKFWMNYHYSYFAGVMAGITLAFILGQHPLKYGFHPLLFFILLTYFAGLICCAPLYRILSPD